ncbi:MAG: bifunctional metallophosphatase/5'-nucleotidase [Planctomycetes bacterium]|nr:bifunctional metallophosphatase/5'-nucleotidase [Planctomycetota bacterium]
MSPVLRGKPVGGYAHLATMVRAVRKECEERKATFLLTDGGDLFQGTPIGNETKGVAMVEAMNLLAYDAVAVGNHEFDFGLANFLALVERARFPMLAANMTGRKSALGKVRPFLVLAPPRTPCRIALIGLITTTTPDITTRGLAELVTFSDPLPVVRALLRESDADLHILITHLGRDTDRAIAAAVPGIDLILGGHSHTAIVERVGSTLILQTHSRGMSVARADLRLDPEGGKVLSAEGQLLPVDPQASEADPAMARLIAGYGLELKERLGRVLGRLTAPLHRVRGFDSSAPGCWMADVLRARGKAEIGFMNKGGIRCDLEAGEITAGDIYRLMPFENDVVAMDLTGAEVRALLVRHFQQGGYPALEWSGLMVEAEGSGEALRLASVRVGEAALEDGRVYRVATNGFLATGGDGFGTFRDGRKVERFGLLLRDALAEDLEARSPLTPPAEARFARRAPVR